jgi:hypothetical protein
MNFGYFANFIAGGHGYFKYTLMEHLPILMVLGLSLLLRNGQELSSELFLAELMYFLQQHQ